MPDNKGLFETLHSDYSAMVLQMCLGFMKGDRDLAKDVSNKINLSDPALKSNNASLAYFQFRKKIQ
jgi:phosphate uptake regulator